MRKIHASAIIPESVKMGEDNTIGANVVFEEGVQIGSGNLIYPGAYIAAGTTIGDGNQIHMGAVIGHEPQDLAFEAGTESYTVIGNQNVIREYVTIHRGTKAGTKTIVGDHNYLMANVHLAHNCELGNHIIIVNQSALSGYCVVEDQAFISGMVGFHQFTRVGRLAIVSGLSALNRDIPPYVMCGGRPARAQGLNAVGLRRAGITAETRSEIKAAFKLIYRSGLKLKEACDKIEAEFQSAEVKQFVTFIRASKRGIITMRGEAVEMKGAKELDDASFSLGS